jgi:PPK2 family polyphosphate:nucleotide phosphotransferase
VTKVERRLHSLRVEPGRPAGLARRDPGERLGLDDKEAGLARLNEVVARIGVLHNRLWAEATRSVLLILQGPDASGKDGTLRHVLTGVSPQGCRVVAFKPPTSTELAHDYLWRVHAACPARGELGVFNRSHYEDVTVVRVRGLVPRKVWSRRYRHIREFERLLTDEGTAIVKVFLHLSRDEQARRLQERLTNPEKSWKFSRADLDDRERWDEYVQAYEEAISETSTAWAPWHVVPADHNWVRNLAVAELLSLTLEALDPKLPPPEPGLQEIEIR